MAKIGITGHNEEEIASMTPEQQARCFVEREEEKGAKPSETKTSKKK
jgi:hypothetical protein